MNDEVELYDALRASYGNQQSINRIKKQGYNYDTFLSNNNVKVFHNPKTDKLLFTGAGTQSISDIGTDINLALGNLKNTDRYKEAKKILEQARVKYTPKETAIVGHSLFGTIAGYIAKPTDKVYTLNKGATLGQPTRKNETALRTQGDPVSLLGAGSSRVKTLKNENKMTGLFLNDLYEAHKIDNIKNYKNIRV